MSCVRAALAAPGRQLSGAPGLPPCPLCCCTLCCCPPGRSCVHKLLQEERGHDGAAQPVCRARAADVSHLGGDHATRHDVVWIHAYMRGSRTCGERGGGGVGGCECYDTATAQRLSACACACRWWWRFARVASAKSVSACRTHLPRARPLLPWLRGSTGPTTSACASAGSSGGSSSRTRLLVLAMLARPSPPPLPAVAAAAADDDDENDDDENDDDDDGSPCCQAACGSRHAAEAATAGRPAAEAGRRYIRTCVYIRMTVRSQGKALTRPGMTCLSCPQGRQAHRHAITDRGPAAGGTRLPGIAPRQPAGPRNLSTHPPHRT